MKIRDIELKNNLIIAPMAGVSNEAFRSICKEAGAGLVCAEMVSDKALYYDNIKTLSMTKISKDEHPISLQLFGADKDSMVYAAKLLDKETDCDIIDINMGCPVSKVIKARSGCALMLDEDRAVEIAKAVVDSVSKPVTVKMRAGFDEDHLNAVSLSKKLEAVGVSAICVHGRTRTQMYEGKADWNIIKQVKSAVSIPVIGNGDVKSVDDMISMLKLTNCDGVAIARAALGNPFLIKQCATYLATGKIIDGDDIFERFKFLKEHALRLIDLKGEDLAIKEMRGHASSYVKGLKGAKEIKRAFAKMNTFDDLNQIIDDYIKKGI